jgi:hypothetical protein
MKMKQTLISICIAVVLFCVHKPKATAQASLGSSYTASGNLQLNLAITPPSPQAAQFQKYGNVPVNYATGVPNIAVPIYHIGLKNFSWPISLSYHAGGNRVDEIASSAGLGWVLMAGGYITSNYGASTISDEPLRTLNLEGMQAPYPSNPNGDQCYYYNETDIYIADELAKRPNVPPIYNITSPVLNTKFFSSPQGAATLPAATGIKISEAGAGATKIVAITDEEGNVYTFKHGGKSYRSSLCNGDISMNKNETMVLDNITTYSGETIQFYYEQINGIGYSLPKSYNRHVRENNFYPVNGNVCNNILPEERDSCENLMYADEAVLTNIEASNGVRIRFGNASRSDMPYGRRVYAVEIYKDNYDPASLIKKIELGQGYFGSGTNPDDLRLKLETVTVKDHANAAAETYSFTYNNTPLPNRLSNNSDAAGFYREGVTDPTHFEIRDYNLATTRACVLEKMTYPTGGNTQFTYGLNPWGGLRIEQIADYDVDNAPYHFRRFEYSGSASPVSLPANMDVETVWMTAPTPEGVPAGDASGIYPIACSKMRYQSSPVLPAYAMLNPDINYYNTVTELYGHTTPLGKTVYYYGANITGNRNDLPAFGPILSAKKVYAQNGSGFTLLQENATTYAVPSQPANEPFYSPGNHPLVTKIWYKHIKKNRDEMHASFTTPGGSQTIPVCFQKIYFQSDMVMASVPLQKTEERSIVYANGQALETRLQYTYGDTNNLAPTEIKIINSDNTALTTKLYYPTNPTYIGAGLSAADVQALTKLKNDNIKSKPYFTETFADGQCLTKERLTYTEVNNKAANNKLTEWAACGATPKISECLQFDARLNCIESKTDGGVYTSAIFSPLSELNCQAVHAPLADIAATSFENIDETGGFNFSALILSIPDSTAPTGKYVATTGVNGISKTGLNPSKTYKVSYWCKNGSCMVNGTAPVAIRTVNGWTQYEHIISNPATGVITITGIALIDELRLHPINATMTTYTYEPLTGIRTRCDAANNIYYYQYDSFKRLQLIKDESGQVVKTVEYKYNATPQQ